MIAADEHDRAPRSRKPLDGVKKHLLCFGGGHEGIEDVSRNEDDVRLLVLADADELFERLSLFGKALSVHQPFADVPVGGVKNFHIRKKESGTVKRNCNSPPIMLYYYITIRKKKQAFDLLSAKLRQ